MPWYLMVKVYVNLRHPMFYVYLENTLCNHSPLHMVAALQPICLQSTIPTFMMTQSVTRLACREMMWGWSRRQTWRSLFLADVGVVT